MKRLLNKNNVMTRKQRCKFRLSVLRPPSDLVPGFILMAGLSIVLFCISRYSYLLFHSLAELFSIIVAVMMFVVAWHTYTFSRNHFLMYLGCGYLWIALLSLLHTLLYKGMNVFPGVTGANPATQFWIAQRYLEALLLITAPFFLTRSLHRCCTMSVLGAVTFTLIAAVLGGRFPDAYLDGSGLTPFKIYSEYLVILIIIGSGLFLHRRRALLSPRIYRLMLTGIVLSIGVDLAFTFYVGVYDLSNLVGHLLQMYSFWLVYEAIVHTTLREPFTVLARDSNTYNAIPQATVLLDQDGRLQQVNKAACRETGLTETELLGRDCHARFHPVRLSRESCPLCQALQAGQELPSTELELDKERGWRKFTLTPVGTEGGQSGMVQVGIDITQRKQAEEQLRAALRDLDNKVVLRTRELHNKIAELEQARDQIVASEKMASLGRLVAGFAHEINTPVGIAVGAASQLRDAADEIRRMLEAEEVEEEELEEVLEIIREGTDLTLTNLHRAAELIQRFKRSSIDRSSEEVRHFRVREVIEDVLTSLHSILKKTQVKVIIECPDELHIISVPGLIEQVLVNLIQNSLKHGFDNESTDGEIHITCSTRGNFHLVYEDNGKGMSSESVERIFEPFYTTKRGSGSGLGMYISYNLVHHHHGTLYCESTLGQGVWFALDLPVGTMADLEKAVMEH